MKRALLAAAVMVTASAAQADNLQGYYIGGGPSYIDSGVTSGDGGSISFTGFEFLGGYKHSPYVGGELRLGLGMSEDDSTTTNSSTGATTGGFKYKMSHLVSAYYRVESANEIAKLYGLLGYSTVGLDQTDGSTSIKTSSTHSGLSYGGGIGFILSPKSNLNIEYRTLMKNNDYTFEALSASYDYRF